MKYLIDLNLEPIILHNEPGSQVIRPCKLCGSMPSLAGFAPWHPGKNHKNRTGYDRKLIMFCSNHDCANYRKMVIGYMDKPIVQWNRWQSPYKRNHRCWKLYNNPEFMNQISRV